MADLRDTLAAHARSFYERGWMWGTAGNLSARDTDGSFWITASGVDKGQLRPYEDILEGTITGYFMGMQNMERAEAEVAAKEHLGKMPAWQCGTGS